MVLHLSQSCNHRTAILKPEDWSPLVWGLQALLASAELLINLSESPFFIFLINISYTSLSSSEILYSKGIQESEVFVKLLTQHLIQYSLKSKFNGVGSTDYFSI
jgi:hypothetical protein